MERLRHDDPPWAGPHIVLARLEPESGQAVPERRFIGRGADGDRTFLVRLPLPGADPARWAVEAEHARRLSIPGFLPVDETGGAEELPWCTTPYVPALSLPAALRAHGGPLPEPAVRALAIALAGTLVTAHAQGVTHAGLSPAAVLLTAEGPRLSCFGAVRAAAPDGERRGGLPGLDSGSLAPEQASGGRPRPRATCTRWERCSPMRAPATPCPKAGNCPPHCARWSRRASRVIPRDVPGRTKSSPVWGPARVRRRTRPRRHIHRPPWTRPLRLPCRRP
ncbi:hypothetical protein SHKM778_04410 [Streptomyces sp. KM77-8]|uniref:Protein kinase domain-containing protein n=1 Tax=Streptomyces haneummycinicus TaxID=3074435 RepID=A0AAT9H9J8_9ACTN